MSSAPDVPTILVAAAVVEQDGRVLVTRRTAGSHLAGYWEFPGGKCRDGEPIEHCLKREMREELDVEAEPGRLLHATRHAYPERIVELRFFQCTLRGEPTPVLGQEMRWVRRDELPLLRFPPPDEEIVRTLAAGHQ